MEVPMKSIPVVIGPCPLGAVQNIDVAAFFRHCPHKAAILILYSTWSSIYFNLLGKLKHSVREQRQSVGIYALSERAGTTHKMVTINYGLLTNNSY